MTGSTSAQNVKNDDRPEGRPAAARRGYSECLAGLQSGAVDALTTDDSILAGFAAQDKYKGQFKLAGLKLSNENYGIGVKKGDTATVDKINTALEKMVSDGSWEKAVEDNFGPAELQERARAEDRRHRQVVPASRREDLAGPHGPRPRRRPPRSRAAARRAIHVRHTPGSAGDRVRLS